MKIYIGADHTGYELKETLKKYLSELELGYEVIDKGAFDLDLNDDYPDFIKPVAESVSQDNNSFGIVIGGSGQGEAMCANKVPGIRAALFYAQALPKSSVDIDGRESADSFEMIKLARMHNDANVLSLGARFITVDEAKFAIELFLKTEFSKEERHIRRINKFN
jgi:ribose 5-phosphate isomerase B